MHSSPPPPELEPFIESVRVDTYIEQLSPTREEQLLKAGFTALKYLEEFDVPFVP